MLRLNAEAREGEEFCSCDVSGMSGSTPRRAGISWRDVQIVGAAVGGSPNHLVLTVSGGRRVLRAGDEAAGNTFTFIASGKRK